MTAAHAQRARPRALLLQQSSSGQSRRTVAALEQGGMQTTWLCADDIGKMPATAEGLRQAFDVIYFGSLALEGGLSKVLTPERLAALKEYVHSGGGLVTVIGEAGKDLEELLPVVAGPGAGPLVFQPAVVKPLHPAVQGLPAKWAPFGSQYNSFSKIAVKPGAEVLVEVPEEYVGQAYPFVVAGAFGRGRVVCFNSLWCFTTGLRFRDWEWAPACLAQLGRWAAKLPPERVKAAADPLWFWAYDRESIPGVPELLDKPVLTPVGEPPAEPVRLQLDPMLPPTVRPVSAAPRIEETSTKLTVTFANGMIADLDKRGMVAYSTSGGLSLARASNEPPHLLFSGTAVPAITKTEGGETIVLQETLPAARSAPAAFQYLAHRVAGDSVIARFRMIVEGNDEGEMEWELTPREQVVEGVTWCGVGETMRLKLRRLFVEEVTPRHQWAPGGTIEGAYTFRSGCYSQPRGYGYTEFKPGETQDAGHFRWFSSGHPFQMFGGKAGTVWCYAQTPALVASWITHQAGTDYLQMINKIGVGRVREVELPTMWYLFSQARMDHNLWLSAYDHLRDKYRRQFGLQPNYPRPTGMARWEIMGLPDLRRYADLMIPLARRLGLRRLDAGVRAINDITSEVNGGPAAFRYLCDKAHEAGIEIYLYAGASWSKRSFPQRVQHPEWVVRGRDGKPLNTGYPDLDALSLRSGWWAWSLDEYRKLKVETGFDGVWLDSWTMPNEFINFAEDSARPTVVEAMGYLKALQDLGVRTWVEGQSPGTLESFWYRHDRYADLQGNEFVLTGTSPFTYNGDGLFHLDQFRLLSYNCAMFQDPRMLYRESDPVTQAATHNNQLMNRVHETIGMPVRVREMPTGTYWECEKGWALFGHKSARLEVSLPAGAYTAETVDTPGNWDFTKSNGGRVQARGNLLARGVAIISRGR